MFILFTTLSLFSLKFQDEIRCTIEPLRETL